MHFGVVVGTDVCPSISPEFYYSLLLCQTDFVEAICASSFVSERENHLSPTR